MGNSSVWQRAYHQSGLAIALIALATQITGCNSSSDSNSATISGAVFAAPVSNATCELQDTNGVSIIQNNFHTNAQGEYSVKIQKTRLNQDMILSCTGGSYTDEATSAAHTAGRLTAYVANGTIGDGDQIHATPESTIVQKLISDHQMTLTEAGNAFKTAFNYDVDTSLAPANATNPATSASEQQRLAGLRAAAFSQLTLDMSLTADQQFALLTALAQDLSNGTLDGNDSNGTVAVIGTAMNLPADIRNRFNLALINFRTGNNDNSGIDNDKLGTFPFARTVITDSYKVEYINGQMAATAGMSQFQIKVSGPAMNNAPVSGLTISMTPIMHMAASLSHSTPSEGRCTETSTAGTYDCTVYYLMASTMASGMSMGYWDLHLTLNNGVADETAHLYPTVMMAMGDTARADLRGVNDEAMSMSGGSEKRRYHIFNAGLSSNNDFTVFIAARVSMMNIPTLLDSVELGSGTTFAYTPSPIVVEMSLDGSSWSPATDNGSGKWTANLSAISGTTTLPIYVKLTINSEQKTTDGNTADGNGSIDPATTNEYATFNVTPGGSMPGGSMTGM